MTSVIALVFSALFLNPSFAQMPAPQLTKEDQMNLSNKFLTIKPATFKNVKLDLNPEDVRLMNGDDLECEHSPNEPYCLDENNEGMIFE